MSDSFSHTKTAGYQFRNIAKTMMRAAGYELRSSKELPPVQGFRHAEVFAGATYSPWLSDSDFCTAHQSIRNNTLVDRHRCYEIWDLVEQSAKLGKGDLIEVGVWRGGTGALIARRAQLAGIPATAFLCDTFKGVVKASSQDSTYAGGEHGDTTKSEVVRLCQMMGLDRVRILEGIFPDETGHDVENRRFRFCHIDVDVYQSAKDVTEWIWPRLVPGGIVVYDDYGNYNCPGITRFINEEREKPGRAVVYNLNGHAIVVKTASETEATAASS